MKESFLFRMLVLLIWLYLSMAVINLAFRLDSLDRVDHDATVVLNGGHKLVGDLRTDWDGTHSITNANGEVILFTDFELMTIPARPVNEIKTPWRGILLIAIWFSVTVGWRFVTRKTPGNRVSDQRRTND